MDEIIAELFITIISRSVKEPASIDVMRSNGGGRVTMEL